MNLSVAHVSKQYQCPLCFDVLTEPIRLPCCDKTHVCLSCIHRSIDISSSNCPFCRTRIVSWTRRVHKLPKDQLIDTMLWKEITSKYPFMKEDDEQRSKIEVEFEESKQSEVGVSKPGELRKEFEKQREAFRQENEEKATKATMQFLQQDEEYQQTEAQRKRKTQAREAGETLNHIFYQAKYGDSQLSTSRKRLNAKLPASLKHRKPSTQKQASKKARCTSNSTNSNVETPQITLTTLWRSTEWQCSTCTLRNSGLHQRCYACNAVREEQVVIALDDD